MGETVAGINDTPGNGGEVDQSGREWPARECPGCGDEYLNLPAHIPTCEDVLANRAAERDDPDDAYRPRRK